MRFARGQVATGPRLVEPEPCRCAVGAESGREQVLCLVSDPAALPSSGRWATTRRAFHLQRDIGGTIEGVEGGNSLVRRSMELEVVDQPTRGSEGINRRASAGGLSPGRAVANGWCKHRSQHSNRENSCHCVIIPGYRSMYSVPSGVRVGLSGLPGIRSSKTRAPRFQTSRPSYSARGYFWFVLRDPAV